MDNSFSVTFMPKQGWHFKCSNYKCWYLSILLKIEKDHNLKTKLLLYKILKNYCFINYIGIYIYKYFFELFVLWLYQRKDKKCRWSRNFLVVLFDNEVFICICITMVMFIIRIVLLFLCISEKHPFIVYINKIYDFVTLINLNIK